MKRFFALFLIFALLLSGCSASTGEGALMQFTLTADPSQLDPQLANSYEASVILLNCMEGLTRLQSDGTVIPGVAARWDVSDDRRTWTFYLRRDAYWCKTDGERVAPVTSADFAFALRRLADPATGSPHSSSVSMLENAAPILDRRIDASALGVSCPDDYTLVLSLAYPCGDLDRIAARTAWLPCLRAAFDGSNGRYGLDADTLVYNGPFRMMYWTHGERIRMKANINYKGHYAPSPSGILFPIDEDADTCAQLLAGETDAAFVPGGSIAAFSDGDYTCTEFRDTVWSLCFNRKSGVFASRALCLSIIAGIERGQMDGVLPDHMRPIGSIYAPTLMVGGEAFDPDGVTAARDSFRPGQAGSLKAQALSELGVSSLPKIDLLCPDNAQIKLSLGYLLQSLQKNLGLYLNLVPLPADELAARVESGQYQIAVYAVDAADETAASVLERFASGNPGNVVGADIPALDSILQELIASDPDAASLRSLLSRGESLLVQDGYLLPLWLESRYFVLAPGVSELTARPFRGGVNFLLAKKKD